MLIVISDRNNALSRIGAAWRFHRSVKALLQGEILLAVSLQFRLPIMDLDLLKRSGCHRVFLPPGTAGKRGDATVRSLEPCPQIHHRTAGIHIELPRADVEVPSPASVQRRSRAGLSEVMACLPDDHAHDEAERPEQQEERGGACHPEILPSIRTS